MRAKVVITAMVLALAILVPAVYFHFKSDSPPPTAEQPPVASIDTAATAPTGPSPLLKRIAQGGHSQGISADHPSSSKPPEMSQEDYVLQRKAELMQLGMNSDPESLKTILSELENPEPEIRQAALTATLDFGGQDAIPTLQHELNWSTDPQEKVDIQKAIDFLQLPTLGSASDVTQQSSDPTTPATN